MTSRARARSVGAVDDFVTLDSGLRLRTRRRPGTEQPPLLLINGIGGALESWAPLVAALPDRDIVLLDLPGTGGSDMPRRPLRMHGIADAVAEAVGRLGLTQVDVLGVSFGGVLVQELTHRHPPLIRRAILASTSFGVGSKTGGLKVSRALLSTKRYTDRARAEREIALIAGGRTARDREVLLADVDRRLQSPPSRRGYRYQLWAITGWGSRRWLSELELPVLVLHGDEDPAAPVANAYKLAGYLPHATLEIVPGAGHLLVHDEPEKAAAVIERFLARA
jgi:pimeloyl-ACP methyl ester carboxylesterase